MPSLCWPGLGLVPVGPAEPGTSLENKRMEKKRKEIYGKKGKEKIYEKKKNKSMEKENKSMKRGKISMKKKKTSMEK